MRLHVVGATDEGVPDADSLFVELDRLVARGGSAAIVWDLTHARPDATRRRRVAEWIRAQSWGDETPLVAVAFVAPGAVQRSLITAVSWLVDLPMRMETFADVVEATIWATGTLEELGLKVPK